MTATEPRVDARLCRCGHARKAFVHNVWRNEDAHLFEPAAPPSPAPSDGGHPPAKPEEEEIVKWDDEGDGGHTDACIRRMHAQAGIGIPCEPKAEPAWAKPEEPHNPPPPPCRCLASAGEPHFPSCPRSRWEPRKKPKAEPAVAEPEGGAFDLGEALDRAYQRGAEEMREEAARAVSGFTQERRGGLQACEIIRALPTVPEATSPEPVSEEHAYYERFRDEATGEVLYRPSPPPAEGADLCIFPVGVGQTCAKPKANKVHDTGQTGDHTFLPDRERTALLACREALRGVVACWCLHTVCRDKPERALAQADAVVKK